MALKLPAMTDTFKVILRLDSAIGADADAYEAYLDSLDEGHLQLKEQPTRFVLRKVLPHRLSEKVQEKQYTYKKGGFKVHLAFIAEDVRCSILSIENPGHVAPEDRIVFKAHSDGGASEELIAVLKAANVVNDLYRAKQTALGGEGAAASIKKKS
jgi:hypothetical protein